MNENELMEMITILLEMPKSDYFRCKHDMLNDKMYESHESTEWLNQLFALIEKNRPELLAGEEGAV